MIKKEENVDLDAKLYIVKSDFVNNVEEGTIEAVVSSDSIDSYKEKIITDAWRESIKIVNSGKPVVMLVNHYIGNIIGYWHSLRQEGKYLIARGLIIKETRLGGDYYKFLEKGVPLYFSVGGYGIRDQDDDRIIKKFDLREISLTPFPANKDTKLIGIKEEREDKLIKIKKMTDFLEKTITVVNMVNKL